MRDANPKVAEIPFSSRNKWQASVHLSYNTATTTTPIYTLLVKGAPERVMEFCTTTNAITAEEASMGEWQESIKAGCEELGSMGERVLAFASREIVDIPHDTVLSEDLILQHMVGE